MPSAPARSWPQPSLASRLAEPHPYPGRLIIVEGIDGSGKSTQLVLLQRWLQARGFRAFFTSSEEFHSVKKARKPRAWSQRCSSASWVDFPDPSMPSTMMSRPG